MNPAYLIALFTLCACIGFICQCLTLGNYSMYSSVEPRGMFTCEPSDTYEAPSEMLTLLGNVANGGEIILATTQAQRSARMSLAWEIRKEYGWEFTHCLSFAWTIYP